MDLKTNKMRMLQGKATLLKQKKKFVPGMSKLKVKA